MSNNLKDKVNAKIVLLNGPARIGKSEAVKYLKANLDFELEGASCKDPLHKATMGFFGVDPDIYWQVYNSPLKESNFLDLFIIRLNPQEEELLRSIVGEIREEAKGEFSLSLRQAMIYVSEVLMKPRFGSDVFGKIRAKCLKGNSYYVDDSTAAFDVNGEIRADELTPLISKVGQENILLLRVFRQGFNFTVGDSRKYIPDGVIDNCYDIVNISERLFYREVFTAVDGFLKGRPLRK